MLGFDHNGPVSWSSVVLDQILLKCREREMLPGDRKITLTFIYLPIYNFLSTSPAEEVCVICFNVASKQTTCHKSSSQPSSPLCLHLQSWPCIIY